MATAVVGTLLVSVAGRSRAATDPVAPAGLSAAAIALEQQRLSADEVLSHPPLPADQRISFGDDPSNFGDLRLPTGAGPHPVAVLIHGGCWLEFATLQYFDRMAVALSEAGVASWNIEYRRIDMEGGGWPNTFLDVGRGVDHLRELARQHPLDLERVVTVGHSTGGHLALWAAGRHRVPDRSEIFVPDPLPVLGAVSLSGVPELRRFREMDEQTCGSDVVDTLMGGSPDDVPARYRAGSPFQLLPLEVVQVSITGRDDQAVPVSQVRPYNADAQAAGDDASLIQVPDAGHFEVVWPESSAWPVVEEAILSLLEMAGSR